MAFPWLSKLLLLFLLFLLCFVAVLVVAVIWLYDIVARWCSIAATIAVPFISFKNVTMNFDPSH